MPINPADYRVLIQPIAPEDGGGFLAIVPELPGCMTDGETPEEAIAAIRGVIEEWIEAATSCGDPIPAPNPRRVYRLDEIPEDLRDEMIDAIKQELADPTDRD
jgi:predicted RNase H-like HicB family nuclease